MNRTSVSSSQIKSVGYDAAHARLEIQFSDGDVYQYDNVPISVYEALIDAESVGKTFYAMVKGKFSSRKV